jgi:hypothetical protein
VVFLLAGGAETFQLVLVARYGRQMLPLYIRKILEDGFLEAEFRITRRKSASSLSF